jgi:hypothetical protein
MTDEDTDTEESEERESESEERRRRRRNKDTESGTRERATDERVNRTESASEETSEPEEEPETQSEVPQIELCGTTPETKHLVTDTEEVASGETGVPQFEFLHESIEARELDDGVKGRNESAISVPPVELSSTRIRTPELNSSVALKQEDEVNVPEVELQTWGRLDTVDLTTEFDKPTSGTVGDGEETDESNETDVEQQGDALAANSQPSGAGELPVHEPFKLLFSAQGGAEVSSNKPVVIWLDEEENENHLRTLEWICRRIYREKMESKNPDFRRITDVEELEKEAGKSWVELGGNKLFTVELTQEEYEELNPEDVETRLEELDSQALGFVIFNTSRDTVGEFNPVRHPVNHIELSPRELSPPELRKIQELCTGFVQVPRPVDVSMDSFFNNAREAYEGRMKRLARSEGGLFWDIAEPDETGESDEHRRMKAIVTKMLVESLREERGMELEKVPEATEYVKAEKELGENRPDILYSEGSGTKEVFEIETLFSEDTDGQSPRDKLSKTFKKYRGTGEVDNVNIVLDSMTFLRHIDQIVELRQNWDGLDEVDFEFHALHLEDERRVSVDDFVQELKELRLG